MGGNVSVESKQEGESREKEYLIKRECEVGIRGKFWVR